MSDQTYFILIDQQPVGPFTVDEVKQKQLPNTTFIRRQDESDWSTISEKPEVQFREKSVSATVRTGDSSEDYYLFGSFEQDLKGAAMGGMGCILVAYFGELASIPTFAFVLESIGLLIYFWGIYQIGNAYQLVWVKIGAKLLILSILLSGISFISSGFISSSSVWLSRLVGPIGSVLAIVDLWPLRKEVSPRLVIAVIIGHLVDEFIVITSSSSFPTIYQLLEAINIGLMAWLFYELIDQETGSEPMEKITSIA